MTDRLPGSATSSMQTSPIERRRAIRRELERGPEPLRVIAEDVLALLSRIDLVALDPRGRALAVVIGAGEDAGLLARALAHRVWLQRHLADWLKLAPELGADPRAPVGALLVATAFDAETVSAAASLPEGWLELAELQPPDVRGSGAWRLARRSYPAAAKSHRAEEGRGHDDRAASLPPFRSGLTPAEIGLTREEIAAFE